MKHRAIIVGAGRIGCGFNWPPHGFPYTHADTYMALKDRVDLVGIVDPSVTRLVAAGKKYDVPGYYHTMAEALAEAEPTIVSVCTPPDQQHGVIVAAVAGGAKGVWCEKPYTPTVGYPIPIQVNYIRRFEPMHRDLEGTVSDIIAMSVCAKKDIHTVSHFTDLARFWGVPKGRLTYTGVGGCDYVETSYTLYCGSVAYRFEEGGAKMTVLAPSKSRVFPSANVLAAVKDAAWRPNFMILALQNLMDAVDGKEELISPADSAIESEKWAKEILDG